jgi:hypothetical protein
MFIKSNLNFSALVMNKITVNYSKITNSNAQPKATMKIERLRKCCSGLYQNKITEIR